ncbi:iripin-2-like [Cochliomyia hominivorax]
MGNIFQIRDHNYVRLIFLNLLLISPLQFRAQETVEDLTNFEVKLFNRLTQTKPGQNLIVTPFSLASLILLLRMNAASNVVEEVDKVFDQFGLLDAVIIQKFKNLFAKYKNPHLFRMRNEIKVISQNDVVHKFGMDANQTIVAWTEYNVCYNSWKISTPNKPTDLVLTSENHFNEVLLKYVVDNTYKGKFYDVNNKPTSVDMFVTLARLKYALLPNLKARVVELPYYDGDTSLLYVIPDKNDGIADLEKNIIKYSVKDLLSTAKFEFVKLDVPKFIHSFESTLQDELKAVGFKIMFERLCDIPHVVRVSEVHYKSSFFFDGKSANEDPFFGLNLTAVGDFLGITVDHPFIYILKSSTNLIYVMGKYLK